MTGRPPGSDGERSDAATRDDGAANHATRHDDPGPPVDERRREVVTWLWRIPVLAALAGGAYGVYRGWQVHFVKPPASADPEFADATPALVAPRSAFAELWSDTSFRVGGLPAIAVRLPEAIPTSVSTPEGWHLAAFSRICTHQGCIVQLNRAPEAIAVAANYRTDHPALVCGCHLSVFEPLASGRAVSGPAQLPLARVLLELRGDDVYAVGVERG